MLIDSHIHLDFQQFDSLRLSLLAQASLKNIHHWIIPAISQAHWQRQKHIQQLLHKQRFQTSIAQGLHPFFINDHQQHHIELLAQELKSNNAVAVGETGLDKPAGQLTQQLNFLNAQFELAEQYSLPIILHQRGQFNELLKVMKRYPKVHGVVHGFSGSYQQAMDFIQCGYMLGIGGVISYPRAKKTRDAVKKTPLEHILIETDGPDMPLNGYQGKTNEPWQLASVFDCLVDLKDQEPLKAEQQLEKNCRTLFQI